jgi:hypothetical protein
LPALSISFSTTAAWGWNIRVADAEIDQVDASGQSVAFSPIDFSEQIRR